MQKVLLAIAAILALSAAARAAEGCEACRVEDEKQIGDYVEPALPAPRAITPSDPRGREVTLPLPGDPTVHHRSGAGVWVGEVGEGNNLFINGERSKATIGVRRDF